MKSLVVYYSLDGNTDMIAQKISQKISADIIRLIPEKQIPAGKFMKFFWGGKSVIFNEKPKLTNGKIAVGDYDTIVIGTPVWAGSFAAPIMSFLSENNIQGKDIYLFACHAGGGTQKCFEKFQNQLSGNTIKGTVDFIEPTKGMDITANENLQHFYEEIISNRKEE